MVVGPTYANPSKFWEQTKCCHNSTYLKGD